MKVQTREHSPKEASNRISSAEKKKAWFYLFMFISAILYIVLWHIPFIQDYHFPAYELWMILLIPSIYFLRFIIQKIKNVLNIYGFRSKNFAIIWMLWIFTLALLSFWFITRWFFWSLLMWWFIIWSIVFVTVCVIFLKISLKKIKVFRNSKNYFKEKESLKNEKSLKWDDITHSMKYFNSKKIKNDFQDYLFWKDIENSFNTFFASALFSFIYFYIVYSSEVSISTIAFSSILFSVFWGWIILLPFFNFLFQKENIQIKTLSLSPKTYAWKDKNTLYFK